MRGAASSITLLVALQVAGCGGREDASSRPVQMPARTWQYYVAHPQEIEPMQAICRQWAGSGVPAGSEPAVVAANCRAAAFAKSQVQLGQ